jgi:hypothetical protein
MRKASILVATALAALAVAGAWRPAHAADETSCLQAGAEAEQRQQLPPGLLLAIGQVESGRRDPATRRVMPWPWTIDAEGTPYRFDDLASAAAATQELQAKGVTSIDVGCFQINLAAHPQAFTGLAQAFDPAANADYASRFLVSLRNRLGSWEAAIAAYHSLTPERGAAYRDQVLAAWGQAADAVDGSRAQAPVVRTVVWSPVQAGIRVWTPSGAAAPDTIKLATSPALPRVSSPRG